MVRVTTSRGKRGISSTALRVPSRPNSKYASSTITTPGASHAIASTVSRLSAVPVGLFGEQTKTMSGWNTRTWALALLRAELEAAVRCPSSQPVPVALASSGCIEYDGENPMAVRPLPPKASSSCCWISLEPLAAHTLAAVMPCPT